MAGEQQAIDSDKKRLTKAIVLAYLREENIRRILYEFAQEKLLKSPRLDPDALNDLLSEFSADLLQELESNFNRLFTQYGAQSNRIRRDIIPEQEKKTRLDLLLSDLSRKILGPEIGEIYLEFLKQKTDAYRAATQHEKALHEAQYSPRHWENPNYTIQAGMNWWDKEENLLRERTGFNPAEYRKSLLGWIFHPRSRQKFREQTAARAVHREELRTLDREAYLLNTEWSEFYRQEKTYLRHLFDIGLLDETAFNSSRDYLIGAIYQTETPLMHGLKRTKQKSKRGLAKLDKIMPRGDNSYIWDAFIILMFTLLGVVVSSFLNETLFLLAFLSWSLYYIFPREPEIPENVRINLDAGDVLDKKAFFRAAYLFNQHTGIGLVRSILKVTTLIMFIFAIRGTGIVFSNLALLIVSFVGYAFLKVTYDPNRPADIIESLIRFFVGVLVIPFFVINHIFQTMVLTFIALAFFAIPPIADTKGKSANAEGMLFGQYLMIDRIVFVFFMLIALMGAGIFPLPFLDNLPGSWHLEGTLRSTFLYFWLVTGIAGFFSSPQTRPTTGFIMLGAATLIYGLGPGTQEFGQGLLGPWFPTVYNSVTQVMEPVGKTFNTLSETFGTAMGLLFDPVGYAQGIVDGTHSKNKGTGEQGALGVEVESGRTTPLLPYQSFDAIVKIKNRGDFVAENVMLSLLMGPKAPEVEEATVALDPVVTRRSLNIEDLGFAESNGAMTCGVVENQGNSEFMCSQNVGRLTLQDQDEIFFTSVGPTCSSIKQFRLREKFIPLAAKATYDYQISSTLDYEFISEDERDRRVRSNEYFPFTKKPATFTNSPVSLNIDTPEQPVSDAKSFFIGLQLKTDREGGKIEKVSEVQLEYPKELGKPIGFLSAKECKEPSKVLDSPDNPSNYLITWTGDEFPKTNILHCRFEKIKTPLDTPTKSFLVKADAKYTFSLTKTFNSQFEFGGGCCSDLDCPKDTKCSWAEGQQQAGICVVKSTK